MIYAKSPSFSKFPLIALRHSVLPYSKADKKALERTEVFEKEGMGEFARKATNASLFIIFLF